PSQTRVVRAQQHEFRRQAKRYPGSVKLLTRLQELQSIQNELRGKETLVTVSQAEQRLASCATGGSIRKARKAIGLGVMQAGERFDLRPVVDQLVEARSATTFYAKQVPSYETLTTQQ